MHARIGRSSGFGKRDPIGSIGVDNENLYASVGESDVERFGGIAGQHDLITVGLQPTLRQKAGETITGNKKDESRSGHSFKPPKASRLSFHG